MLLIRIQQDQRGGERGNYLEKLPLSRRDIQRVAFGTYVQQQPVSRETAAPFTRLTACCIGSRGGATVSWEGWIGGHSEHTLLLKKLGVASKFKIFFDLKNMHRFAIVTFRKSLVAAPSWLRRSLMKKLC